MKKLILAAALVLAGVTLSACDDARVASQNISKAADNFEINRRIVFFNGITDTVLLEIRGLCSQEPDVKKLAVICKTGPGQYKKHFLGLSDNVSYFSEQLEPAQAGVYMYRVTFKPSVIVPSIDVR